MTQPPGVAPLKDFVLSMTCIGNGGSITKSIPVTVTHPKPTLDLTVSPTTVNPNEQITVTWNSTYATGCYWGTGSLPYNSNIGLSGSIRYPVAYLPNLPAEWNHIVSMHCKGNGWTVVKSVPVTVNVQKPQVYLTSSTLTVNPIWSIRVDWYSTFATDCYYGESKIPGPRTPALSGSIYLPWPFNSAIPPKVSVYCEWPGGSVYNSLQFQYPQEAPFVILNPETSSHQYIPWNSSNLRVGSVTISAGLNNDVIIDSIILTHTGYSSRISDISHMVIAQSGAIISEKWIFDPVLLTSVIKLKYPITIKAKSSQRFDFLLTLNNIISPQAWHNFMITGVINSTNSVRGIPIIIWWWVSTTTYKISTLTVSSISTPSSVVSGELNTRIATITMSTGSSKSIRLQDLILTKIAGTDYTHLFSRVWMYRNGNIVGTAQLTPNKIFFTGIDSLIIPGEISEFEIRADVIHTGTTANTSFMINDVNGISAIEDETGYFTPVNFPLGSQWLVIFWK